MCPPMRAHWRHLGDRRRSEAEATAGHTSTDVEWPVSVIASLMITLERTERSIVVCNRASKTAG